MPKKKDGPQPSVDETSILRQQVSELQQANQGLHNELQQSKVKGYDLYGKLDEAYANHQQALKVIVSAGEKIGVPVQDGKIDFGQVLNKIDSLVANQVEVVPAE